MRVRRASCHRIDRSADGEGDVAESVPAYEITPNHRLAGSRPLHAAVSVTGMPTVTGAGSGVTFAFPVDAFGTDEVADPVRRGAAGSREPVDVDVVRARRRVEQRHLLVGRARRRQVDAARRSCRRTGRGRPCRRRSPREPGRACVPAGTVDVVHLRAGVGDRVRRCRTHRSSRCRDRRDADEAGDGVVQAAGEARA